MIISDVPLSLPVPEVVKHLLVHIVFADDASATSLKVIAVPTTDDVDTSVDMLQFSGVESLLSAI